MAIDLWAYSSGRPVPVIDLFAGPGGLGEGFSRAGGGGLFRTVLSIEMDVHAHSTLTLRAFQRAMQHNGKPRIPPELVDVMRGDLAIEALYEAYPEEADEARREALLQELCPQNRDQIIGRIKERLHASNARGRWVLIGGPPCQAYSLVGRARRSKALSEGTYSREDDHRHFLYREYLQIIAECKPAVFVMENVKGLLSSEVGGEKIFPRIRADLENPAKSINKKSDGPRYRLFPMAPSRPLLVEGHSAKSFIIRSENCGVPQRRHRVIIVGVREDTNLWDNLLNVAPRNGPHCIDVIDDLPEVRSGLSRESDSTAAWCAAIRDADWDQIVDLAPESAHRGNPRLLRSAIEDAVDNLLEGGAGPCGRGANVLKARPRKRPKKLWEWYRSENPRLVFNHEARSHMISDLHRYLYAAVFAKKIGQSPKVGDFPQPLFPDHANVLVSATSNNLFADRFRVQMEGLVPTTVTSHISKDGHGFIHYDPTQCRALTVREAARIQTFPDDYCFLGPRTAQYHQVGNAVPPYLAAQIAEAIARATGKDI